MFWRWGGRTKGRAWRIGSRKSEGTTEARHHSNLDTTASSQCCNTHTHTHSLKPVHHQNPTAGPLIQISQWVTKGKLQDCHYAVWFSFDHQDIWGSWECSWPFWMRPKQENYPQIKKQQCWFWGLSWDPWKTSITDSTFIRDKLEAQLSHEVALNICNKCNRKRGHSGVVCNTASLQEGPGFKSGGWI